jgi:hypothetical protein
MGCVTWSGDSYIECFFIFKLELTGQSISISSDVIGSISLVVLFEPIVIYSYCSIGNRKTSLRVIDWRWNKSVFIVHISSISSISNFRKSLVLKVINQTFTFSKLFNNSIEFFSMFFLFFSETFLDFFNKVLESFFSFW